MQPHESQHTGVRKKPPWKLLSHNPDPEVQHLLLGKHKLQGQTPVQG